jgi:hypothetical protein
MMVLDRGSVPRENRMTWRQEKPKKLVTGESIFRYTLTDPYYLSQIWMYIDTF